MNSSQKKIVDFILKNGKITNKEVQQLLAVKDSRALKVLKELVEMDIILKQGKLKGSYYTLKKYEQEGDITWHWRQYIHDAVLENIQMNKYLDIL